MNIDEINREILECSRYGEDDDLKAYIAVGVTIAAIQLCVGDVNYSDESGNTGLHRAAANGHAGCINILLDHGAVYKANSSGNFPIHWAAQNAQPEALKVLLARIPECNVLAKNDFGRSTLTEAFDCKNSDVLEACLTHPSSAEDKMFADEKAPDYSTGTIPEEENEAESDDDDANPNAIFHNFNFSYVLDSNSVRQLKIRELPISRADNPFGSDENPEEDTTGLGIWPASLLAAHWIAMSKEVISLIKGKTLLELGAGCGVPGLSAAAYCGPKTVYISDINDQALENAIYNVKCNELRSNNESNASASAASVPQPFMYEGILNSTVALNENEIIQTESSVRVIKLNWLDKNTFPSEEIDVILGSDLVYERRILVPLTFAITTLLSEGGSFLYVAPDENRDGLEDMIAVFAGVGLKLKSHMPCPDEYYSNPILGEDKEDQYVLHFYDLPAKKKFSLYHFVKESK